MRLGQRDGGLALARTALASLDALVANAALQRDVRLVRADGLAVLAEAGLGAHRQQALEDLTVAASTRPLSPLHRALQQRLLAAQK